MQDNQQPRRKLRRWGPGHPAGPSSPQSAGGSWRWVQTGRARRLVVRLGIIIVIVIVYFVLGGKRSHLHWISKRVYPSFNALSLDAQQIINKPFPSPYEEYTWSLLQARVEKLEETQYLEILAFVPASIGNKAHLYSLNLNDIVQDATCRFGSGEGTAANALLAGTHPRVVLYRCPLPESSTHVHESAQLELHFKNGQKFIENVQISPPKPAPTDLTKLSVCTSPVYGKLDKLAVLEWRLHHAQLGVQSVHWYVRETGTALEAWIRQWNGVLGLKDTWRYAPALATNQSEALKLYNNGAYADQVAYHMDCLARVRHDYPSEWVSIIDLDEYYLPQPFDSNAAMRLDDFLDQQSKNISSICIARSNTRGPPILTAPADLVSQEPSLLYLGTREPIFKQVDEWSLKCLHRPQAIELVFTHWPETFRPGQPDDVAWYDKPEEGVPVLAHLRRDKIRYFPFKEDYPVTQELRTWVKDLWQRRDKLADIIGV